MGRFIGCSTANNRGITDLIGSIAFSPDSKYIAGGLYDNTIKIWEVTTGKLMQTLTGHTESVRTIAYSPNGKDIVSGSRDNTVKIWETETGKLIRTLTGHTYFVLAAAYSPDGSQIITCSKDSTLKIWEAANGKLLHTFEYQDEISSICIFTKREISCCILIQRINFHPGFFHW